MAAVPICDQQTAYCLMATSAGPGEDAERLSTEKPNQVNHETPRETLLIVLQRDGSQLGFASPALRADKEAGLGA
ncbi:hypothetical protein AK812_SmicGene40438 [Symbiodinium microadriaticum]|uniref:Uncharacterized protein n=1 Tax=Symbiodinium microadriaticum TaxID=2951 RepID=A0A1Q9C8M1_SYMMI|nr:hypothetical protein AK812_SmicGene40438 [Symbiodinium microadriaticum]